VRVFPASGLKDGDQKRRLVALAITPSVGEREMTFGPGTTVAHALCSVRWQEAVMTHAPSIHGIVSGTCSLLEHTAAVVVGVTMMIMGLGLSVTMVMLPVGLPIGLLGVAILVSGVFAHLDDTGR
jgi:hypothetical protein